MMCMILSQIEGMGVVASLPEDLDGCLYIKVDFTLTLCLDEFLQLRAVLELGIAVQKQGGMISISQRLPMQGLQVGGQVVDALGIQKLPDHIGWLQLSNGSDILLHSPIMVALAVEMVSILHEDLSQPITVQMLTLSQINCHLK